MFHRLIAFISLSAFFPARAAAQAELGFDFTQPEPAQAATSLESGDAPAAENLLSDAIKSTKGDPRRLAELRLARAIINLRCDNAAKGREELPSLKECSEPQVVAQAKVV